MEIELDKNAKALIFDIDGTLADSMPVHYHAWQDFFDTLGLHYPADLFYKLGGIPAYKIVPILNEYFGINLDVEDSVRKKENYFLKNIDKIRPIQPVVDIVKKYHGKLPMSLGTGGIKKFAELIIRKIGLGDYFDIIITAEDVTNHKPHPETFLKCAQIMNVKPEFCQVFEDADNGIIAGHEAGMIVTDVRKFL